MIACLVFLSLSFVDQRDEVKMVRLGAEGKVQGSGDTDDGVDNDDGVDSDDDDDDGDVLRRERRTLVTGVTQIPSLAVTNVVTTHGARFVSYVEEVGWKEKEKQPEKKIENNNIEKIESNNEKIENNNETRKTRVSNGVPPMVHACELCGGAGVEGERGVERREKLPVR